MNKKNRGGKREGAGRPKTDTVPYRRRINPLLVEKMDEYLKTLKTKQ